jgi:hypothetical protein
MLSGAVLAAVLGAELAPVLLQAPMAKAATRASAPTRRGFVMVTRYSSWDRRAAHARGQFESLPFSMVPTSPSVRRVNGPLSMC